MDLSAWALVGIVILCVFIGFAVGWILSAMRAQKQIQENPPITEAQIRDLYKQAGKTLSESQVLKIMNSLKQKK